ncbi:hypothetical protein DT075_03335 [Bacillus licheniformis]|nr:hypothetical protein DT075_03335 [Bacillus licheniformis]
MDFNAGDARIANIQYFNKDYVVLYISYYGKTIGTAGSVNVLIDLQKNNSGRYLLLFFDDMILDKRTNQLIDIKKDDYLSKDGKYVYINGAKEQETNVMPDGIQQIQTVDNYLKGAVNSKCFSVVIQDFSMKDRINSTIGLFITQDLTNIESTVITREKLQNTLSKGKLKDYYDLFTKVDKYQIERLEKLLHHPIQDKEKYHLPAIKMLSNNQLQVKTKKNKKTLDLPKLLKNYGVKKSDELEINLYLTEFMKSYLTGSTDKKILEENDVTLFSTVNHQGQAIRYFQYTQDQLKVYYKPLFTAKKPKTTLNSFLKTLNLLT